MQDPNADTEWNDVLRAKGIIPPREKEITEEDVVKVVDSVVEQKLNKGANALEDMTLDELDDYEFDEEDERAMNMYRQQRLLELKVAAGRNKFGDVLEISAVDYVAEVNEAGEGINVVLHLYKQGIPLCTLINDYLCRLAAKFPATKFIKSVSTTCIPNYPDKNLPTIFMYRSGDMIKQLIGPHQFGGMNLKCDELEWTLSQAGAVESDLESDPRPRLRDVMSVSLKSHVRGEEDSDDD